MIGPLCGIRAARKFLPLILIAVAMPALAADRARIGAVDTNFRWFGPDDKVVVERYDDPRVGVSCYVSRADTGGVSGAVGLASDPSRFSVSCRATGPDILPSDLPDKEKVYSASASPFFKSVEIYRMPDRQKNMLIYLAISTKLIKGSPFNSLSVIAADHAPPRP